MPKKLSVRVLSFSLLMGSIWLSIGAADTYDAEVAFANQIIEDIDTLKTATKAASISKKQAKHLDNRLKMADHSMDKGIKELEKDKWEKATKKLKDAQKKITEYSRYLSEQVNKGGKSNISKKSQKSKKSNKGGIDEAVAEPLRNLASGIRVQLEQLIRGDIGNGVPVANAGSDLTASLGDSITLNGSASSDPDGDQITFQWTIVSEPPGSSIFVDNETAVTPSFSPTMAGVYTIELVVSDAELSSAADTVSVSVSAANTQPVANAGVDQAGDIDIAVTLDGSGSSDADGDPLSYRWALVSTPTGSQASLETANPVMPSFVPDLAGLYEIALIVNDSQIDSDTDLVGINILILNTKPIAHAGPDQSVFTSDRVTLDGSASSDVDSDTLSWFWSLTTLPSGSLAQLDDEFAVNPEFDADLAGQYVAQLVVNDGEDDSDPDAVVVNAATPNTIPLAIAGADQSQFVGNLITLDGSASSDADGDSLTFNWSFTSIPEASTSSLDNEALERPVFVLDLPGTYIAQLIVNDGLADSAPDETVVSTLNSRPVANAGVDQIITIGDNFQLDGSASSDADGDALTYQWSISTQPTSSNASLSDTQIESPTFEADQIGVYVFQLIVNDGSLASVPVTQTFRVEPLEALSLTLDAPEDLLITNQSNIRFIGNLNHEASLSIGGQPIILDLDLTFDHVVILQEGANSFDLIAVDLEEEIRLSRSVTLDTSIPPAPNAGIISVGLPGLNGFVTIEGEAGSVERFAEVIIVNLRTDEMTIVFADANGAFSVDVNGIQGDSYVILSEDAASNQSDTVEVNDGSLPDDPVDEATTLSSTGSTTMFDATSFLYAGVNPIQTGVSTDTIEANRAAVIRGKVMGQQNDPLSGVTVTVKDHPEYGQTITRSDGMFDLVVNGGSKLVVNYAKENYLPVQRSLDSRILQYQWVEDIVMMQLDPLVSTVNLLSTDPLQIARSSTQSDVDGSRTALLMFSQGTSASMIMPDGSTQALTSLDVRATEYTVGDAGPNAMPGPLPATSGYNYAVELSVDEAVAAGAKSVTFSQPVKFYLENFTGYNNGASIPVGYYDFDKAAWLGSKDGRIIQITAITGDLADIDIDGDDIADDDATLELFNIDIAERRQLAIEYSAGQSLWRVEVSHFSPYDCNWPYGPPAGSSPPPVVVTPELPVTNPENIDKECGCIIGASNQTLGEFEPVSGTDLNIFYQSKYSKGYAASRKINIPVTLETVPASLQSVQVDVYVAGTRTRVEFDSAPGQSYQYVWDGLDAYGREVLEAVNASVQIRYNYPIIRYETRPEITQSWATLGNSQIELGGGRNSGDFNTVANFDVVIGPGKAGVPNAGLGGWTLSNHHFFESTSGTLFLGTGDERKSDAVVPTLKYLGGGGIYSGTLYNEDRLPSEMNFISHTDPVAAPDGGFYVGNLGRILKIGRDNTQQSIAGDGTAVTTHGINITGAELGDGGDASEASFRFSAGDGMGLDASGNLYFASSSNGRIRKIDTNNIITTVSGDQSVLYEDSGNGGLAVDASLNSPRQLVVGPDGSLYFVDLIGNPYYGTNYTIRVIRPDGTIHHYAGGGSRVFGSNNDANEARIQFVADMVIDSQGNLYIVEDFSSQIARRVRKITPGGTIETIAGGGPTAAYPGIRATEAAFPTNSSLAIDSQDRVYIATQFGSSAVYRIENGILILVAGKVYDSTSDDQPPGVDGGLAFGNIGRISGMTFLSDESLMFNTTIFTGVGGYRIDRGWLFEVIPGLQDGVLNIASDDGVSVFQFDDDGKHLRTVNGVTGAAINEFTYNEEELLSSVEDAFGNVININRDANGEPVGILSADGQVTDLSVGTDGFLASVNNPLGDVIQMEYGPDGLLSQFTDKKGNVSAFTYDDLGLLTRDVNPAGGSWQLARTVLEDDSTQVSMTTGEGRIKKYIQGKGGEDFQTFTVIESDGSRFTSLRGQNGSLIETFADGSVTTTQSGPDPVHGMQIPVNTSVTSVTPSGITSTSSLERVVTLTDEEDPFSISAITETGTTNGRTGTTSYDAITQTWTRSSPESRSSTVQINPQGQPVLSQITGLASTNYSYDSRGRLQVVTEGSGADARVTTLTFYPSGSMQGYLESIEDAEQQLTRFEYDLVGRVVKQVLPDLREIAYSYDANGNLASLKPSGRPAHVFNYTGVDLTAQYIPPAVDGIATPQTTYSYNLDKQLTAVTRPDGQQITMNYGTTTGLLDSITTSAGSYDYAYDSTSAQLLNIVAPDGGSVSYDYDGFLLTDTNMVGDVSGSVGRTYDENFRINTRSINGANTISYAYDNDNLLVQAGSLNIDRETQRAGLIKGTTLGSLITVRNYNDFAEMSDYAAIFGSSSLFSTDYTRDKIGRIEQKTEVVEGDTSVLNYEYDLAGRLSSEIIDGVTTTYTYDANGNRTHINGLLVGSYDDQDRLITYRDTSYQYADSGDLLSKIQSGATTSYEYDVLGNLRRATLPGGMAIDYVIDGQNRRVGKKVDGILVQGFLYKDQLNPVAELDGDNNIVARFTYGTRTNVPDYMEKGGNTYRIISDHLGSPRLLIDIATGTVVQRIDYDTWGNILSDSNPGFQPFGFAGGIYDQHTQLTRFGARDYDAITGRWTNKDPILFAGRDTNLYGYVMRDPVNLVDTNGLVPCSDESLTSEPNPHDQFDEIINLSPGEYPEEYSPPELEQECTICVTTDSEFPVNFFHWINKMLGPQPLPIPAPYGGGGLRNGRMGGIEG